MQELLILQCTSVPGRSRVCSSAHLTSEDNLLLVFANVMHSGSLLGKGIRLIRERHVLGPIRILPLRLFSDLP